MILRYQTAARLISIDGYLPSWRFILKWPTICPPCEDDVDWSAYLAACKLRLDLPDSAYSYFLAAAGQLTIAPYKQDATIVARAHKLWSRVSAFAINPIPIILWNDALAVISKDEKRFVNLRHQLIQLDM